MHKVTKRAAAFSAAIVGVALIGAGCSEAKQAEEKGSEIASSASSVISSTVHDHGSNTNEAAPSSTVMQGPEGKEYTVSGPILEKYDSLTSDQKQDLGEPTQNEQKNPDGGVYQQFEGGVIVHTSNSYVTWGKIRDKWNELGGSQGKLGYPTSDEGNTADGGKQQTFEHGVISWKPGEDQATVEEH